MAEYKTYKVRLVSTLEIEVRAKTAEEAMQFVDTDDGFETVSRGLYRNVKIEAAKVENKPLTRKDVIAGLNSFLEDRELLKQESFRDEGEEEEDTIFAHDAAILTAAIELLEGTETPSSGFSVDEILSSLEELIQDRQSFLCGNEDEEEDSVYLYDIQNLQAAIAMIQSKQSKR